jgi:hypothetical protein
MPWQTYSCPSERLSSKNKRRLNTMKKDKTNMDYGEDCSDSVMAELMEKLPYWRVRLFQMRKEAEREFSSKSNGL